VDLIVFQVYRLTRKKKSEPKPADFIDLSELELKEDESNLIGIGGQARVFRAKLVGSEVAVKIIHSTQNDKAILSFRQEVNIHVNLHHPRVVQVIGIGQRQNQWLLVTEYCAHKSLHDVFCDEQLRSKLDPKRRLKMAIEAAEGMAYLHFKNILHLDLKPLNLLVTEDLHVKVADFGLSKWFNQSGASSVRGFTPCYVAPELLQDGVKPTYAADVFSFSFILLMLLSGKDPLASAGPQVFAKLLGGWRPAIPSTLPKGANELVTNCWSTDVSARPTFKFILEELRKMEPLVSGN